MYVCTLDYVEKVEQHWLGLLWTPYYLVPYLCRNVHIRLYYSVRY